MKDSEAQRVGTCLGSPSSTAGLKRDRPCPPAQGSGIHGAGWAQCVFVRHSIPGLTRSCPPLPMNSGPLSFLHQAGGRTPHGTPPPCTHTPTHTHTPCPAQRPSLFGESQQERLKSLSVWRICFCIGRGDGENRPIGRNINEACYKGAPSAPANRALVGLPCYLPSSRMWFEK